jgi:hypothetical protein
MNRPTRNFLKNITLKYGYSRWQTYNQVVVVVGSSSSVLVVAVVVTAAAVVVEVTTVKTKCNLSLDSS